MGRCRIVVREGDVGPKREVDGLTTMFYRRYHEKCISIRYW